MERRSKGSQAGAEGAPGQRDAGRIVGTASSVGETEKPDRMQEWNGLLYRIRAQGRDKREQPERTWCGAVHLGWSTVPGPSLAGVANGQTNPIFQHAGTRVLADGTQNAITVRLLGRAGGNAGVLKPDAAETRLGGAPVD